MEKCICDIEYEPRHLRKKMYNYAGNNHISRSRGVRPEISWQEEEGVTNRCISSRKKNREKRNDGSKRKTCGRKAKHSYILDLNRMEIGRSGGEEQCASTSESDRSAG